jgi:uncharacterized glyoxalase superfamily protein PhnB
MHTYDPARGFPRIMPSLRYEDVGAALDWLQRAFGLSEHLRWVGEDGLVRHAEVRLEGAFVELSAGPEGYRNPKHLGQPTHALVVLVDDVDRHFEHARAAGALIVTEPEDKPWGLRQYTAEDPEGHPWEFSQFLRDVPPEEWGATLAE